MDGRPARVKETLRAGLVCLVVAAAIFAPALVGEGSVLSFHPEHPAYPRPWVRASEADWPAINPITSDIDFFVLPGLMRAEQPGLRGGWDAAQLLGYPAKGNMPFPVHSPLWALARAVAAPVDALALALWWHTALAAWLAWRAVRWLAAGARAEADGSETGGAARANTEPGAAEVARGAAPTSGRRALSARSAPWVAAVGAALGTWMVTRWHLPQVACASVWWGGLVVGVERLRRGDRLGGVAELGLWGGLALLSGFPQVALLLLLGATAYALLFGECRRPRTLLALGAGLALALLFGARELNVVRAGFPDSMRADPQTSAATAAQGLLPGALAGAVLPRFFGTPSDFAAPDPPAPSMEAWLPRRLLLSDDVQDNPVENALYPGFVILLLLPLAWRAGRAARRLLLLAVGSLALAMLLPWFVELVPWLGRSGGGSIKRALVLWGMSLPLVAGLAWAARLEGRTGAPRRVVIWPWLLVLAGLGSLPWFVDDPAAAEWGRRLLPELFVAALTLLVSALVLGLGPRRRGAAALVPIVLLVELVALGWTFNPLTERAPRFPRTPGLSALGASPGRLAVLGGDALLPPTATSLHGLRSVHGAAPMVSRRTAELLSCIESGLYNLRDPRVVSPFTQPESLEHPLLDLLGVDRVVFDDPALPARLGWPLLGAFEAEGFGVLERPGAQPLVSLLDTARIVPEREERLALLRDRGASWRGAVLLEQDPGLALANSGAPIDARWPERPVHDGLLILDLAAASAERDLIVRLAESWDAGWSARLDGEPVPVLHADHALMAVAVPAGSTQLVLEYGLPGESAAMGLAGLGQLSVIALGCALFIRRRSTPRVHAES